MEILSGEGPLEAQLPLRSARSRFRDLGLFDVAQQLAVNSQWPLLGQTLLASQYRMSQSATFSAWRKQICHA